MYEETREAMIKFNQRKNRTMTISKEPLNGLTQLVAAARRCAELETERDALKETLAHRQLSAEKSRQAMVELAGESMQFKEERDALRADNERLREAMEGICNFAWSLAAIDGKKARENINDKLAKARQTLAATPADSLTEYRNGVLRRLTQEIRKNYHENHRHSPREWCDGYNAAISWIDNLAMKGADNEAN